MRRSLFVGLLLTLGGLGIAQNSRPLDLCAVTADLKTYSGREVRITAFIAVGRENVVLFDPKCQDGKPLVWVEFKRKVSGKTKALRRLLEKRGSALVTVEGTMRGGEPMKVDPKLPDWLKDRFKGASKTYGHLGSFDMMIEVGRVVQAKDANAVVSGKP